MIISSLDQFLITSLLGGVATLTIVTVKVGPCCKIGWTHVYPMDGEVWLMLNGTKWLQMPMNGWICHWLMSDGSKWLQMTENGRIWHWLMSDGSKWLQMTENGCRWHWLMSKCSKWLQRMVIYGNNCCWMDQNGLKMGEIGWRWHWLMLDGPKWVQMT